jgi:hypothetical protein
MTTDELTSELKRQIAVLRRERRMPKEIRIGAEYMPTLLCATEFLHSTAPTHLGSFHGWRIMTGRSGEVTVIPEDWGGYGQGMVRPR